MLHVGRRACVLPLDVRMEGGHAVELCAWLDTDEVARREMLALKAAGDNSLGCTIAKASRSTLRNQMKGTTTPVQFVRGIWFFAVSGPERSRMVREIQDITVVNDAR